MDHLKELQAVLVESALRDPSRSTSVRKLALGWKAFCSHWTLKSNKVLEASVVDWFTVPGVKALLEKEYINALEELIKLEVPLRDLLPLVVMSPCSCRDVGAAIDNSSI
eukprot:4192929-Amphidinium_carterae.2